jgi:hypothetical protein
VYCSLIFLLGWVLRLPVTKNDHAIVTHASLLLHHFESKLFSLTRQSNVEVESEYLVNFRKKLSDRCHACHLTLTDDEEHAKDARIGTPG